MILMMAIKSVENGGVMFNLSDGLTAIIQLDQATIKSRDRTH